MKHLLLPLLAFAFAAGSHTLQADCTRPPQGVPGFLSKYYIGSYSDTVQPLDNGVPEDVVFPSNSTPPVGIAKSGSNDSFTIQHTGVYLIYWTANVETIHVNNPPQTIELNVQVNGTSIMSRPSSLTSLPNFATAVSPQRTNLSGRTTLVLQAGDVITLQAIGTFTQMGESMQIDSALIDIIQLPSLL